MGQIRPTCALLGFPASLTAPSLSEIAPYLLAPVVLFGPLVAMYLDGDLPLQQAAQGAEGVVGRIKNAWRSWSLVDTRNYIVVSYKSPVAKQSSPQRALLRKNWSFDLLSSLLVSLASYPRELWSLVHHYGSASVCDVSSSLRDATDKNIAHAHHAWDTYKRKGGGKAAAQYALGSTGMSACRLMHA